jgi:hypothetical protein
MLRDEQPRLFEVVVAALAEYTKTPSTQELEQWWMTCRVFSLDAVERALKAHAVDPDDGKRAPRPVDVKRRLVIAAPRSDVQREGLDPDSPRMVAYRAQCIRSPSVRKTAQAIALRHGNRPWWPDSEKRFEMPQAGDDRQ